MLRATKVRAVLDDRLKVMSAYKPVGETLAARPEPKGHNALHETSAHAARVTTAAYDDLIAWRAKYAAYLSVWTNFADTFREVTNQISELEDVGRPAELDRVTDAAVAALIRWRNQHGNVVVRWAGLSERATFFREAIQSLELVGRFSAGRACIQ